MENNGVRIEKEEVVFTLDNVDRRDIIVIDTVNGNIKTLEFVNDVKVINETTISLDGIEFAIPDIKLENRLMIDEEYIKTESVYLKYVEDNIPDDLEGFPYLIKYAFAKIKNTTPMPLSKTQHARKLHLIRDFIKAKEKGVVAPVLVKVEELLHMYGINANDLAKDMMNDMKSEAEKVKEKDKVEKEKKEEIKEENK